MLSRRELLKIARARIRDAKALYKARRFDGAAYVCGYALECALKARIVSTLHWLGFPETQKEFNGLQSFKTHNLDTLLSLSGREAKIKNSHLKEWSGVAIWEPEARYKRVGSAKSADVALLIQSAEILLRVL
jgi:hypothetical protein